MPKLFSILKVLPPELWFTVICIGMIVTGILDYFLIQFDIGINRRNQMDLIYMIIIHSTSTFVSNAHNIKPKNTIYRILYGIALVVPMIFQGVIGITLYHCMKDDMFNHQMTTFREIVDSNFRLAGSAAVLHMIQRTGMVS